jgi:hypothetical protein
MTIWNLVSFAFFGDTLRQESRRSDGRGETATAATA